MKKRYLILAFMIIIQFFVISSVFNNNNENVYVSKKKNEKTDGMLSILIENEDRTGYDKSHSNNFPQSGYLLNLEKSKCVDAKGKLVNSKLTQEDNAVILESKYTSFCYIYFDRIYKITELCNNGVQLGMCLLEHNEDIISLGDTLYSNMYRYNGKNKLVDNNYVCFGTDNKNTCLNNKNKYLYRMIGVTGESNDSLDLETGQVKLIKNESINEQSWYTSNTSDKNWINSTLYTYLQNDFLNNTTYFPSGWLNKISSVKWKVGTILSNANLEQIDSLENSTITTTNTKIGLMYLSDYLYAHNNSLVSDCNSKPCESWLNDTSNYLWTMAYARGSKPYSAWVINQNHFVEIANIDKSFSIKPVFYLNSNELYESGNGTIDDPIIIKDKEAPENGSIVINDNATYTTNSKVSLKLNSNGATKMCISQSTSCNNWENYATTKEYTLSSTLGTKTVYVYYKDDAGNLSEIVSDTIKLYEIVSLPTQSGTLTYTSSSQTPTWSNYNSSKLTISGTTSGINATSYTAKFTPKTNYIWSDGTTTTKNVTWTIAKAVVSVPTQKGTETYTGSRINPTWNNYDSAKLSVSGTTYSTNAGSYTAKFTPKSNYMWSDGTTSTKNVTWAIKKAVVSVPSQKGTAIYTGSRINPTWNNYDSAKLSASGTTYSTNAGSYTAKFTPKTNYMWSDGTQTTKNVTWKITKASGSLTLNKTSINIKPSTTTTVTATVVGNGTLSVTSSDTSVATVTLSGKTLTIKGVKIGTATITVKVAEATNYTAPANKTITVNVINPFGEKVMSLRPTGLNYSTMKGGLYRFYGDGTVNNYVCFGTTNKSTCTSNPGKYMYRIIGITSDYKVKLIKKEALDKTFKWNVYDNEAPSWATSNINKGINGTEYLNNITYVPSGWSEKIETYNWKYGSVSDASSYNGNTMYNLENAWTKTYSTKIGLMYIHDYFYAYNSTGIPGDYTKAKNAWIFLSKNDSNPPHKDEWTMTSLASYLSGIVSWYILGIDYNNTWKAGMLGTSGDTNDGAVRPVFYLKSNVSYLSGTGTSSNPFIIE